MQVPASRTENEDATPSTPVREALDEIRGAFLAPVEPQVAQRHLAAMLAAAADPVRC